MMNRAAQILMAAVFGLHGALAAAVIPDWPQAGWSWSPEQAADLSGVRLFQRELSAPSSPAEMAQALAARLPQLNRLTVIDGRVLLSGLDEAHHWLAAIEGDAAGARAMVSALAVRTTSEKSADFEPARYVPADARLQFSHIEVHDGRPSSRALYESSRGVDVLTEQMGRVLSLSGWRRRTGLPGEAEEVWRRGQEYLRLSVHGWAPGSMLWLQHQTGAEP